MFIDHKPLVPLTNTKDIDKTPVRCQRTLIPMMHFKPVVQYVPGKEEVVSDALTRKPRPYQNSDVRLQTGIEAYVDSVQAGWPVSPGSLEGIRQAMEADKGCSHRTRLRNVRMATS